MRENLVVVRCGRASLHPTWVADEGPRNFDLWTCPYEEAPGGGDLSAPVRTIPGGKWAGLSRFLEEERGWRDYGYVWLPDDDLATDAAALSRFLDVCRAHGAALAAPALAEGSQYSHVLTLRNRAFRSRATTFVEIMAPCFRRDVLEALLPTFRATTTGEGWGLDDAWGRLLGYRDMLVVDEVAVRHDRPVGSARTRADREARRAELRSVQRRFDACSMRKTLAGTDDRGVVVPETAPGFIEAYLEGYRWLAASKAAVLSRLRRDQAKDPQAWLDGAPRRARRGAWHSWWRRLRGRHRA